MRNAFAAELTKMADEDPRIVLLSGDIGNKLFDDFQRHHPARFINCGVAEANMISVAAGLALSGMRPITYTITPFTTTRVLEQIRVDVCYHNVPVVVGVGAGLSYAANGATHHSCEDIAILRVLPHMSVVCPGDAVEVPLALRAAVAQSGPVYLRLGKKGEPKVHSSPPEFRFGKAMRLRTGTDVALINTGNLLSQTLETAERLEKQGLSAAVFHMHTVKPLDAELLKEAFAGFAWVATVEEHSVLGGLGGSVAEWLADHPGRARLLRIGAADEFLHEAGEQEHAREVYGLTPEKMATRIETAFRTGVDKGAL